MIGLLSRLLAKTRAAPVVFVAKPLYAGEADMLVAALQARGARVEESIVGQPYFTYAGAGRQIDRSGAVVVLMDGPTSATCTLYELRLAAGLEDRSGSDPRPTFVYGRRSDALDEQLTRFLGEDRLPTFLPDDLDAAIDVVVAAASRSLSFAFQ
jgi:hypothetical protein